MPKLEIMKSVSITKEQAAALAKTSAKVDRSEGAIFRIALVEYMQRNGTWSDSEPSDDDQA